MTEPHPRMRPPEASGPIRVARIPDHWYVACRSDELGREPLHRTVLGIPLVLFRDASGTAAALLDRCPHRNVPLSEGRVLDSGRLECRYHGWQFDGSGRCRRVPCLLDSGADGDGSVRRVTAHPVRERDGFVWVYGVADAEPVREPFPLPHVSEGGYTTVRRSLEVEATVHATAENILDVPHTAYLHARLFRSGERGIPVTAEVRRGRDRVEAEYMGEPRPTGLLARLLSPGGGTVEHWDRFILPSIAQVEYRLGPENHVLVTNLLTPVEDYRTRIHAVITFRVRLPGRLVRLFLEPLAMRVFRQDAEILEVQTGSIRRFGGEHFMSTEVDVLGRDIWWLMRQAERGGVAPPRRTAGDGEAVSRDPGAAAASGEAEAEVVRRVELMV